MSHHEIDADTTSVFYAAPDLNGVARGKQIPGAHADKVLAGTARMPLSVLNVDLLGHDIEDSPLVFETGDQDGILQPTERGIVPMPWLEKSSALLPVSMFSEGGTPFSGDPRHALKSVMERYSSRGWNVVAATELEFYLVDASANELKPPRSLLSARRLSSGEILSLDALEEFSPFFSDLYEGCALMGIGADAASSEGGPGQFEINLKHGDALKIADDTWLFKMLVRGLARKHGLSATFMAKPFADQPGNGLHVHFSVVDLDGKNVFDDGTNQGSNIMRHAVAGLLNAMAPHTAI
ncbi:MAG: glutamine synthetase family protein, partial [Boseongicola sp.]|nr:glutamine synthetase family protein [Boseongicola sp.]